MSRVYTCIIIDDEPHALLRLRKVLKQTGKFEVIAEAKDGIEGKELINSLCPEVVFLDIQMPGMDGFEMLEQIERDPYVIFCTAYDKYAIKAFETHSVDYLLKPIEIPRLLKTIEKLYKRSEQIDAIKEMQLEIRKIISDQKSNIIPVKIGDRIILEKLDRVCFFEANEKCVYFFNADGKKYMVDYSLQALEVKLPDNFIRVSRSTIVNKNYISECRKYFKGKHVLIIEDRSKSRIITGNSYKETLNELLRY